MYGVFGQISSVLNLELEKFRSKYNRNNPTGSNQNIIIMIKLSSIYKHDSFYLLYFTFVHLGQ